ncbi:hypothetical protein C8R44DRAFT_779605 [Mycena epipterygia]|nr:hypothetical protein C8R44DRAFT_779605 [Mycena epipterygia]
MFSWCSSTVNWETHICLLFAPRTGTRTWPDTHDPKSLPVIIITSCSHWRSTHWQMQLRDFNSAVNRIKNATSRYSQPTRGLSKIVEQV